MEHPLRDRLARSESVRVLIAGDTHGNRGWVEHVCVTAAAHGCELIIQLGDFGFDPKSDSGTRFLNAVSESCEQHGVELWWLDGNHENHFELAQMVAEQTEPEPIWIRPHLWYLPRGTRLHLAGRTLGVLGGAFSVDWRQRTIGTSWWPNEVPTEADVELLGTEPLDVLLTHDIPTGIHISSSWRLPPDDQVRADAVRVLIRNAMEATGPAMLLHGHWHHRHSIELPWIDRAMPAPDNAELHQLPWRSTMVHGLDCDDTAGSLAILESPSLLFTDVTHTLAPGRARNERGAL
jgi:hypothetical protein